ncbi:hypothetical protein ACSKF1_03730 [Lactiplantibacillus plantarum]|uniref:hypothetical protein n=1 Tax=Lactiplantibacillus plantarum TaxID=1590 RepID=UPI003F657AFC
MTMDELLATCNFPNEDIKNQVIQTLNALDDDGKKALLAYNDESSDFFQNAQPMLLASRFLADPKKYPKLYHYTKSSSLKLILRSRTFLTGSISEMNDSEEIKHTNDMCLKILKSLGASKNELDEFSIQFIATMIHFDIYLWCFTNSGDSMAMSRYGDTALEFNNQDIQNNLASKFTPLNFANGYMKSGDSFVFPLVVNYDQEFQEQYLIPILKVILGAIRNIDVDPSDMKEILQNSLHSIFMLSLCFKRPEIWEEREIRFVVLRLVKDGSSQEEIITSSGKHKVKIPLNDSTLKQIILDRNWENKESDMRNLLDQFGFNGTRIRLTKIPYL